MILKNGLLNGMVFAYLVKKLPTQEGRGNLFVLLPVLHLLFQHNHVNVFLKIILVMVFVGKQKQIQKQENLPVFMIVNPMMQMIVFLKLDIN